MAKLRLTREEPSKGDKVRRTCPHGLVCDPRIVLVETLSPAQEEAAKAAHEWHAEAGWWPGALPRQEPPA